MAAAARRFDKQCKSYNRHLDRLRNRISEPAWQFFRYATPEEGLHDGRLLRLQIGDALDFRADGTQAFSINRARSCARFEFLNYQHTRHYVFECHGLRSFQCELFPAEVASRESLGDLYIYEIRSVSPSVLGLGFLFATGAWIDVEFQRLVFKRRVRQTVVLMSENL